jgi:hypothetical protein
MKGTLRESMMHSRELVSAAGGGIITFVAALVTANRYLRKTGERRRMIADCARQSSYFEGARGLKVSIQSSVAKRRRIASAKKLVKAA